MSDKDVASLQRKIYREIQEAQSSIKRTIDAKEHAKIVKAELKKKFPAIKFRVKTQQFSGGTSVTVYHVGKVPPKQEGQIKEFVDQFDGFRSDLMDGRYNVGFLYEGERIQGASFCSYNYQWHE